MKPQVSLGAATLLVALLSTLSSLPTVSASETWCPGSGALCASFNTHCYTEECTGTLSSGQPRADVMCRPLNPGDTCWVFACTCKNDNGSTEDRTNPALSNALKG